MHIKPVSLLKIDLLSLTPSLKRPLDSSSPGPSTPNRPNMTWVSAAFVDAKWPGRHSDALETRRAYSLFRSSISYKIYSQVSSTVCDGSSRGRVVHCDGATEVNELTKYPSERFRWVFCQLVTYVTRTRDCRGKRPTFHQISLLV